MKNIGVNRAPVQIHHSGWAGDSGRYTFEKKNKKKMGVTFSGIKASRIRFRPANRVGSKRGATLIAHMVVLLMMAIDSVV